MRSLPVLCLWLLPLFFANVAFAQAEPPAPRPRVSLDLAANALVVSGVTPSGQVAWFGVQRQVDPDYSVTRSTRAGLATAGADGTARVDFERPLANRAIWVVVDLTSGESQTATPAGYPLVRAESGHSRLVAGGEAGDAEGLLEDRPEITGLLARPGGGAWWFAAADGGADDEDGKSDGSLLITLPRLLALEGGPEPPEKLGDRDLWFVIDPLRMDLVTFQGGIER